MRRPEEGEFGPYYKAYIDKTRGVNFAQNLADSADMLIRFLQDLPEDKRHYSYADGKWTIHQILQHIIDADLVFIYRALWIARGGEPVLPGFEQDDWAAQSLDTPVEWEELITQFKDLRNYCITLFRSFPEKLLDSSAQMSGYHTTLRSLPFIIAGHTYHHIEVLKSHYQ